MLIDTHAHLNFEAYEKDREEVIGRCQEKEMAVINVGAQFATSRLAVELADDYGLFYAAIGLHPIHVFDEEFSSSDYQGLIKEKVVAIGETGFDFWWFKYLKEEYKIVILHGWGGTKDDRFYQWLDEELTKSGHQVLRFTLPDTENPKQEKWLNEVKKQVGYVNKKTLFVGFSLGGTTILKFLESLDTEAKIGGAFLLGTPTQDFGFDEIRDFFNADFNWEKIHLQSDYFSVYHSSNDEYIPYPESQALANNLKTSLKIVEGLGHFKINELPELLTDIKKRIAKLNQLLPSINYVIKRQQQVFLQQIKLAKNNNLALICHGRDGLKEEDVYQEILRILQKEKIERAVIHFYGGDLKTAQAIVNQGYYVGIDGPVTFNKKADQLQQIAKEIPLDRILIETDCPFIAPEPHRGKKNEPIYVELVAKKIAELKGISKEEVVEQTWQNAKNLFRL